MKQLLTVVVIISLVLFCNELYAKEDKELRINKEGYSFASSYNNKLKQKNINLKFSEVGVASWYGKQFQGKKTASGAVFNPNLLTAAHKYLPLNSVVRVTNLNNKKSIKVVINDRGPFINQRIIDLSRKAAQELDFHHQGLAKVKVEYLHDDTMDLSAKITPRQRQRLHRSIARVASNQITNSLKAVN